MSLDQIPGGARVLLDANVILLAIRGRSKQCGFFLERCAAGAVDGQIPLHVLMEITHQLMIVEAKDLGLPPSSNPARKLSSTPDIFGRLRGYLEKIDGLLG